MNNLIRTAMLDGRAMLFLGAGASQGSVNSVGMSPPMGSELAALIAAKVGWPYANEPLGTVYAAAKDVLGSELDLFLRAHYKSVKPSAAYETIARFPWSRIYTTNIDDALEAALKRHSKQRISIKYRDDQVEDKDQLLGRLEYVYLNGSIGRPDSGYVFSAEEYGNASARQPLWYEEVAADYLQCMFIFIGTSLAEPVLYHHIERFKERAGKASPQSYLIVPHASPIQIASFGSYHLEYVEGSLAAFAEWMTATFAEFPGPIDIAQNKIPELRVLLSKKPGDQQQKYAQLLQSVQLVTRQEISSNASQHPSGTIRPFYKGFKPNWRDIVDNVPAVLTQYSKTLKVVRVGVSEGKRLLALVGPAGSGKSTLLKWLALALADEGARVYFLGRDAERVSEILTELEKANGEREIFVFVDRLDPLRHELGYVLDKSRRIVLVGGESKNVWHNRLLANVPTDKTVSIPLDEIAEADADLILEKLQLFGPWTRLSNLSKGDRRRELFVRSKRQLLIGLMEATTGVGFEEIIFRDFSSIGSQIDKNFFVVVCIATMHRSELSLSVAARTLGHLGASDSPSVVALRMQGLIELKRERLVARHPVYARKIIESVVDREVVFKSATALLASFTVYSHPVVKSLDANDANLFRSIFNHRFLNDIFRGNQVDILRFYSQFEKQFEKDGLFWLQYGLSMRSFDRQLEAFELLQTARNAYPHEHTIHALAQQKMILAGSDLVHPPMARSHLEDAIKLLEGLDDVLESDDTYPIVTLAEGHVKALRKLDGIAVARVKAREYVSTLERRLRRGPNPRLDTARTLLFTFSATGTWNEDI